MKLFHIIFFILTAYHPIFVLSGAPSILIALCIHLLIVWGEGSRVSALPLNGSKTRSALERSYHRYAYSEAENVKNLTVKILDSDILENFDTNLALKPTKMQANIIHELLTDNLNAKIFGGFGSGKTLACLTTAIQKYRIFKDLPNADIESAKDSPKPMFLFITPGYLQSKSVENQFLQIVSKTDLQNLPNFVNLDNAESRTFLHNKQKIVHEQNPHLNSDFIVCSITKLNYFLENRMLDMSNLRMVFFDEASTLTDDSYWKDFAHVISKLDNIAIKSVANGTQVVFLNSLISSEFEAKIDEVIMNFQKPSQEDESGLTLSEPPGGYMTRIEADDTNCQLNHIRHVFNRCISRNHKTNKVVKAVETHLKNHKIFYSKNLKLEKVVKKLKNNNILIICRNKGTCIIYENLLRMALESPEIGSLEEEDDVNPYLDRQQTDKNSLIGVVSKDFSYEERLANLQKPIVITTVGNVKGTDFNLLRNGNDFSQVLLTFMPNPESDYLNVASRLGRANTCHNSDNLGITIKPKIQTFVRYEQEMVKMQKLEYLFRTDLPYHPDEIELDSRAHHEQEFHERHPTDQRTGPHDHKRTWMRRSKKRLPGQNVYNWGKKFRGSRNEYG